MIPKFRAWDKELQTMLDVSLIDFKKGVLVGEHWKFGETNFMNFDEIKLMQSTGLKDKNGQEIFEGDVVRQVRTQPTTENEIIIGVVTMIEGAWLIMNDGEQLASYLWSETDINEIIGNIYENSELLEGKE
ncbi:hypothetical protein AZJ28_11105 [Streptococcus pneumoniae]|jgi:hypothetical protein|uniref:YopX protein domain-containing protein n=1 Tax=Streptococcus pneumoniae TaxID=1313 RepID=A0A559GTL5_STREE|nr:hypothetical protein AZJ28_11105 [Streptococcus pneumoniae]